MSKENYTCKAFLSLIDNVENSAQEHTTIFCGDDFPYDLGCAIGVCLNSVTDIWGILTVAHILHWLGQESAWGDEETLKENVEQEQKLIDAANKLIAWYKKDVKNKKGK